MRIKWFTFERVLIGLSLILGLLGLTIEIVQESVFQAWQMECLGKLVIRDTGNVYHISCLAGNHALRIVDSSDDIPDARPSCTPTHDPYPAPGATPYP